MLGWSPTPEAVYESLGAVTGTTIGTALPTPGSINTKGAWTLIGTTGFRYESVTIQLGSSLAADVVVDIGVDDGAGNRYVLIPDLRVPALKATYDKYAVYSIPLAVRSGAAVYARSAGTSAAVVVDVSLVGCSNGFLGSPGAQFAVALYAQASSRGIALDGGGVAHTKSAWVLIHSGASYPVGGFFACVGPNNDVSRAAEVKFLMDIGLEATTQLMISNIPAVISNQNDTLVHAALGPWPCDVPSGIPWYARLQSTSITAGDRTLDLALWGLVY